MIADTIIATIALLVGGFMLIDGNHVIRKGRYIGPSVPGPWRLIFEARGVDVFRLGPLFVAYGLVWLVLAVFPLVVGAPKFAAILIGVATLWYLPLGTLLSLSVISVALFLVN